MNVFAAMPRRRLLAFAGAGLGLAFVPAPLRAQQGQAEAAAAIKAYQAVLLNVMQNADRLGYDGRYRTFDPVVRRVFDLAVLAQGAVGRQNWNGFTEPQQKKLTEAFSKYSVAQHAGRFDGFDNERFEAVGVEDIGRGGYLLVKTVIVTQDERISLDYLMQLRDAAPSAGRSAPAKEWRIVDVFAKGISEIATRRADFATTLKAGGVDALAAELERKAAAAKK
jgi:phospholipid transport system substrate-binding protein